MKILQRDLYQQLKAEANETRERIASIVLPLDLAKLQEHPESGGWSIAQVMEHLCVADEKYEDRLKHMIATARMDASAMAREWKSSFIGGMIAESLLKPKKLKAPKVFEPGPTPRDGVVEALLSGEKDFVKAMDASTSLDWRKLRIKSPALPSWAPSMNLGDGFRIHIVHLTRHSHQIERIAKQL
ncbi:MAG TPA: DinB family protein [Gemmatimonadaceae bacterium]|nr:DinB family protein [Gemmatimonadaceae bacterium]